MSRIKIGVTGTGSLFGQAIIKSILRSKFKDELSIVGFDYFSHTIGSYWVDRNLLLPDYFKEEIEPRVWLEKVIEYISSENIKIIFIGIDFELKLFAKHKETIESKTQCKVLVSNQNVVEIANDKYSTYRFLKDNKLYYPKTMLPEEISEKNIEFPCILKPRVGCRSRGIFLINNGKELRENISKVRSPIIQEYIGTPDREYTCGVICFDGGVKGMIALRRDLKDGNTVTAYFTKDAPGIIYDYIYDATNKLKPFGACNFQLRLGNDGAPKIFEINARHSGTTYIRALFGFNEVECLLARFLDYEVEEFKLREGIVKRYQEEMFLE